ILKGISNPPWSGLPQAVWLGPNLRKAFRRRDQPLHFQISRNNKQKSSMQELQTRRLGGLTE
ncbi:hypothetical protein, partial [Thermoleptolyngbya sp. M55_K2018_002]|uniref:hypothetical protein n=1 Tax=Thermoleptolyngbya sp. M55_K2018_002 TaxID=2747808 RepID=UPI0025D1867F